jgi:hypothetical protein
MTRGADSLPKEKGKRRKRKEEEEDGLRPMSHCRTEPSSAREKKTGRSRASPPSQCVTVPSQLGCELAQDQIEPTSTTPFLFFSFGHFKH